MHKLAVTGYKIFCADSDTVDVNTIICIVRCLAHLAPLSMSLSTLFMKEETTFWLAYRLVMVERGSVLTSTVDVCFRDLALRERKYLLRKAKTTRPLGYRMANFGSVTWDVVVVMWKKY